MTDTKFSADALFRNQIMYPELACREALINAITHRDYSSEGRGIEVKIFDDRLTIENPGELLSSITVHDLESLSGAHQSRNTYIARVLRETGYIRELGEGIRRIFELLKNNDMVQPKIKSSNKTFSITLFYKYVYTKEEQLWLDNFDGKELSREQKTVVRLGVNGRLISPKEIFEVVGIVNEQTYRELIESLRKLKILNTIVTNSEASNLKRKYKGSRKSVPKYSIAVPTNEKKTIEAGSDNTDNSDYAKVFVGNIAYKSTEEDIITALNKFGEIVDVNIQRKNDGKSKGCCIIEFDKKIYALNALNSNSPIMLEGRQLYLQEFIK